MCDAVKNAIILIKSTAHHQPSMQRTKKDIYALIQKGERLHAECKEAFDGMPDTLWESYSSALLRIGERSGAGLSDHYGQREKYGFTSPVIEEKFNPNRTVIRIAVGIGLECMTSNRVLNKKLS